MNLTEAIEAFPKVAKPIIIKADLLRLGLRFSEAARKAIEEGPELNWKAFFNYGHERGKTYTTWTSKIPRAMYLEDGTRQGTMVEVRGWEHSEYVVDFVDNDYALFWNGQRLCRVWFDPMPDYYKRTIAGVPMASLVQAHGDQLIIIPNRVCEFFTRKKQCLYCDLTTSAAGQRKAGEKVVLWKDPDLVGEVLEVALKEKFRHLAIAAGAIITPHNGMSEADYTAWFYGKLAKKLKGVWYGAFGQVLAQDDEGWRKIHDTGLPTVQPNIEVWDKRLFEIICPGKAHYVGYDEWIKRTLNAAKYWGGENVNPSFVLGVEMAKPFGFKTVDDAVESTVGGYDWLMREGIFPRAGATWLVQGDSKLAGQEPAPLEYYIKVGLGYLETREKHGYMTSIPTVCRGCWHMCLDSDFEYWHGNGPYSRKAELADPGVKGVTGASQ